MTTSTQEDDSVSEEEQPKNDIISKKSFKLSQINSEESQFVQYIKRQMNYGSGIQGMKVELLKVEIDDIDSPVQYYYLHSQVAAFIILNKFLLKNKTLTVY